MTQTEDTRSPEQKARDEHDIAVREIKEFVRKKAYPEKNEERSEPAYKPHSRTPESFLCSGSLSEQVELQIAMLTQGVVESMMLSSGEFSSDRAESPPVEENVWLRRPPPKAALSRAQMARSADLKDAARLSEASAKLLSGFAKLRGQFKQEFTVHHTNSRDDKTGERKRVTVLQQNYSTPRAETDDTQSETTEAAKAAAEMALEALSAMEKARHSNGVEP